MTRRLLVVPVLLALLSACSQIAVAAATVNGQKITEAQVEDELDTLRGDPIFGDTLQGDPESRGQYRRQILTRLIYQAIAEQEAAERDIAATEAQADRVIEQAASARGQSVEDFLEAENLSADEARTLAERDVLRFELADQVLDEIEVEADVLRDVYEAQQDRFDEVHLERITVDTADEAQEVLEAVEGDDFADVASEMSTDELAAEGGDMGFVPISSLPAEAQQLVLEADEDSITDPVQTESGFQVYRLVERRTKTFEEVEDEIREALTQEQRDTRYNEWLYDQVREADVVVNPKYGRFDAEAPQPAVVSTSGQL